jgi:hypothetical protein
MTRLKIDAHEAHCVASRYAAARAAHEAVKLAFDLSHAYGASDLTLLLSLVADSSLERTISANDYELCFGVRPYGEEAV